MVIDDGFEAQSLGLAAGHRQHVDAEGILEAGLLVKHVDEVVHVGVFPEFKNDADALLGGLVGNIHDIRRDLVLHQIGHVVQEFADVGSHHRVGNLSDDQPVLAALAFFHFDTASQADLADAGLID